MADLRTEKQVTYELEKQREVLKAHNETAKSYQQSLARIVKLEQELSDIKIKQSYGDGEQVSLAKQATALAKSIGDQFRKNAVSSEKSLIFAKALREKRGNLLEKERGIAETLSEQITSNDVNKDLADKSLDILKSLQMGNLDVNELKNLQLDKSEATKDAEKELVRAINETINNEQKFLAAQDAVLKISDEIKEKMKCIAYLLL